jgi:hypothetical protein
MSTKRFTAICAVGFLVTQIFGIAIHGFILRSDYLPFYGTLLRSMDAEGQWQMMLLPVAHLAFTIAFVWTYTHLDLTGPWFARGLRWGLIGYLMGQVPLWLLWYAEQPWPGSLVVKQLGLELIASLVLGLVVARMTKPVGARETSLARAVTARSA